MIKTTVNKCLAILHQLLITGYTTNCTNFYIQNYFVPNKLYTLQRGENTRPNYILGCLLKYNI